MTLRVSLSSADLPERNRSEIVREVYGRVLIGCELAPLDGTPLDIDMDALLLDGCGVGRGTYGPMTAERSGAQVDRGADHVLLAASDGLFALASDGDETITAGRGRVAVLPMDRASTFTYVERQTALSVWIRRDALVAAAPFLDFASPAVLPGDTPALALLFAYAAALLEPPEPEGAVEALAARQLAELAAAVLASRPQVQGSRFRSARLAVIRRDMRRHFRDPTLNVARLAAQHRMSPRYLQMLFESEGQTASTVLLDLRLDHAMASLTDPRRAGERIAAIAFDAGFAELSTFNRAFLRRFGDTPSAIRAASARLQGEK